MLQFGHYYVIDNYFDNKDYYSFLLVSDSKEEATLIAIKTNPNAFAKKWKVKGICPDYNYKIEMRPQYNLEKTYSGVMSGKELINQGIDLGNLSETTDKNISKAFFLGCFI